MKYFFKLNNNYITIEKDEGESKERFTERCYFILKYIEENKIEKKEEVITLSRVWANIKFDKCKYTDSLMNLLEKYI